MRTAISLLLLFLSYSTFGLNKSELCQITKTERKVHMEQVSDHVGYCGPFAFRALINEFLCEETKHCNLPAIGQIITNLNYQDRDNFNSSDDFYNSTLRVLHKKGIFPESCFPFEKIFPKDSSPRSPESWNDNFNYHFGKFLGNYLMDSYSPESECYDKNIFSTRPIKKEEIKTFQFGKSIEQEIIKDVGQKIVRENNCKATAAPEMIAKSFSFDKDNKGLFQEKLKEGPIMIGLEINQPSGDSTGPHAVVVTNFEKSCCFGVCETRYHLLDSLGHYWAPSNRDGWVSEEDLFNAIKGEKGTQILKKD